MRVFLWSCCLLNTVKWMTVCMDVLIDGWMDGWIDNLTDGWMRHCSALRQDYKKWYFKQCSLTYFSINQYVICGHMNTMQTNIGPLFRPAWVAQQVYFYCGTGSCFWNKNTGATNIRDTLIPVKCLDWQWASMNNTKEPKLEHLNGLRPSLLVLLLFTPVLFELWQGKCLTILWQIISFFVQKQSFPTVIFGINHRSTN